MVTHEQAAQIEKLRESGMGYRLIANELGLSRDTVRYFCKTQDKGKNAKVRDGDDGRYCTQCGRILHTKATGRPKKFCSDACRLRYWKEHCGNAEVVKVCAYCGKTFNAAGHKSQKYCCRDHYFDDYFA